MEEQQALTTIENEEELIDQSQRYSFKFAPLKQDLSEKINENTLEAIKKLRDVVEKEENITLWNSYEFDPPQSSFPKGEAAIKLQDIFSSVEARLNSELTDCAMNDGLRQKKLNDTQLDEVSKTGSFNVPSNSFQGQHHTWEVARFLQYGSSNILNSFQGGMAFALESLLVWIPGVLWRYRFSSWEMLKTIFSAVRDLVWLPFGRAVRIHHFDEYSFYGGGEPDFIRKERRSFVMRDLRPHPSDGQNFVFITPQGLKIDLRLNDDDVLAKFNAPLSKILEEHNLEWTRDRVRFETNLANDLRSKDSNLSENDLNQQVLDGSVLEERKRLLARIKADETLKAANLTQLILENFQAGLILDQVHLEFRTEREKFQNAFEKKLIKDHAVRSRISQWKSDRIQEAMQKYDEEIKWKLENTALTRLKEAKMKQWAYLYERNLTFSLEFEPELRKILSKENVNVYSEWSARIWLKHNFVRNPPIPGNIDIWTLDKWQKIKVAKHTPFWRLKNIGVRWYCAVKNVGFFTIASMTAGPLGFKALVGSDVFYPDTRIDSNSGELVPNESMKVLTLQYRLSSLWENITTSVANFERQPEGFLSKNATRLFVYFWNFVLKGVVGSLFLVLGQLILSILNIVICLVVFLTIPAWSPLYALLGYLGEMIFLSNRREGNLGWTLLRIIGIPLVIIADLLAALVGLPLFSTIVATGVSLLGFFRLIKDNLFYFLFIRRSAKIPLRDGFLVRRTHGPGMASRHFYQVSPSVALISLQLHMEQIEMTSWREDQLRILREPVQKLSALLGNILGNLGGNLSNSDQAIVQAEAKVRRLESRLDTIINKEHESRAVQGYISVDKSMILQQIEDHQETMQKAPLLVETFYKSRILPYQGILKNNKIIDVAAWNAFWNAKNLAHDDWAGLSKQLFQNVFSPNFLQPLEENDKEFAITINHLKADSFVKMLIKAKPRDDLDEFKIKPFISKQGVSSTLVGIPARGLTVLDEPLNFSWLPQNPDYVSTFRAISIKIDGSQDRNLHVALVGKKSKEFTFKSARLLVLGKTFWESFEKLPGQWFFSSSRARRPTALIPTYFNPLTTFPFQKQMVDFDLSVDYDVDTLKKKLQQLKQFGNPTFQLCVHVSLNATPSDIFQTEESLFSIETNPQDLLDAMESNTNLCDVVIRK